MAIIADNASKALQKRNLKIGEVRFGISTADLTELFLPRSTQHPAYGVEGSLSYEKRVPDVGLCLVT